jgi:excisionase family DNA binding protein
MASRVNRGLVEEILGGDPVLTPAEVQARLGLTRYKLEYRVKHGKIQAIKVAGHLRFRESAVTAYLQDGA